MTASPSLSDRISASAAVVPPLQGLVLAGGASSRMRRDKATLPYEGRPQLARAVELLSRHVRPTFVSVRSSQVSEPARAHYPLIVDAVEGEGPIVGIRSALASRADCAWLVIACDLPFLSDAVLARLIEARDPTCLATAFRSTHDGLPEPLCAIWEPGAAAPLAAFQATGRLCPRKFLIEQRIPLIEAPEAHALDNVNTPEEYAEARGALEPG